MSNRPYGINDDRVRMVIIQDRSFPNKKHTVLSFIRNTCYRFVCKKRCINNCLYCY